MFRDKLFFYFCYWNWYATGILFHFPQDGDHDDDDQDEDGPREANPEGRVEKYIGVKVKVSVFLL